ncbi:Signal transduction histidine kinase [Cohaesibacter sp. ES.047]|uniref:ATP-binding protein n=1 Tax=Cohaesibacter sp. ES.047 TaxID=1798205 RepID=UPI000BB88B1B|nr:ATP-binding protein [Cohaesibacter sp. ES.047]SNY92107.1 Signal transduction histidine kinase [Cohaesibacter sp. ES.047]
MPDASPAPDASPNKDKKGRKATPFWRRLRLWPLSLAGQLVAALLIALVIAQVITIFIFANERSQVAVMTYRGQVLDRTASLVRVLNQTDESVHARVIQAAGGQTVLYSIRDETPLSVPKAGTLEAALAGKLEYRAGLAHGTVRISDIDESLFWRRRDNRQNDAPPRAMPPPGAMMSSDMPPNPDRRRFMHERDDRRGWGRRWREQNPNRAPMRGRFRNPKLEELDMTLAIPLDNGKWLQVRTGLPTLPDQWGRPFLISLAMTALLILLVVLFTVRRLTAPLRDLERASRKLGRGETIEPLKEAGPKEVRNTISAFNAMQERLMRFVQDRTRMLAAVSHDLRTPITTMRLRAEFVDDEEMRDKILATLDEMQAMTDAVLAFTREDATNEKTREVDIAAMLSSLEEDYQDLGKEVCFQGPDSLVYPCRAVSLKRALCNLIENALRYAGDAKISLSKDAHGIHIRIMDSGPGIPAAKLEEVFSPFYRVEGSRNKETGGVGLGLSITRTIIRSHGGDVTLTNRPEGGLEAIISLPR